MNWIKQQMALKGISQRELALSVGLTDAKMSNVLRGERLLKSTEADDIRRFFGYALPEDNNPTIAVVGRVAAGNHIQLEDDFEKGAGLYTIRRPAWIPNKNVAAAEISGSSAEPWALAGDIIFWQRQAIGVLTEDLGRPVIAELEDGTVVLKRLATGSKPGLWSLISLNPTHPNIFDVHLRWASRVFPPLSQDEVEVVNAN